MKLSSKRILQTQKREQKQTIHSKTNFILKKEKKDKELTTITKLINKFIKSTIQCSLHSNMYNTHLQRM